MHNQLKHRRRWGAGKSVWLFVFFFSILLTVTSVYLFSKENTLLKERLAGSQQDPLLTGYSFFGWSCAAVAITLIITLFTLLFKEIARARKINDKLKEQKDYYHITINSINEGLITTGKTGEILYMNPAAEKLTGWTSAEAKGMSLEKVYEVINEEPGKSLEHLLSRILRKGQTVQFENNILLNTKSRHRLSITNSGSPLFDEKGNISGAVMLFNDISEKKKNEQQLQESDLFNRGVLDALGSYIAVINAAGTIIKVNKAWNAFPLQNSINGAGNYEEGTNYFLVCKNIGNAKDATGTKALNGIKKVFSGELDEFYLEYPFQDGAEEKWFNMQVMKFESTETLLVIEHHDISERKKEEEKTLKAIEQYEILSQATSDTIWDWDIPHNQIIYNDGILKMFGYNISEVENAVDWWEKNIHPDDWQRVSETLTRTFKKGIQNLQLEYRFRCASGSFRHIYDRAFVIYDANGGPTRIIGAMQDVTYEKEEEKRIAKTIIDAQEKERHYIGQELHDNINQILAGSLLTIAMVKQKQTTPERVTELIDLCEEYLVQAIEEVRKLSHKLAPAYFEETTLKAIFEDMLLKINLNNRFNISFHFDEVINAVANEDIQINLYRIMQEQVKNILKYSAANVLEVTVSLSEGNTVKMRTFDNGKGFNMLTVKKGIGLSNIKKRVDSFSGTFILNSAPGQGCEMIIEIPLNNQA